MNRRGDISGKKLAETYALTFTCVVQALIDYYSASLNTDKKNIAVVIDYRGVLILAEGKVKERFNAGQINSIFADCKIAKLRKLLRKVVKE